MGVCQSVLRTAIFSVFLTLLVSNTKFLIPIVDPPSSVINQVTLLLSAVYSFGGTSLSEWTPCYRYRLLAANWCLVLFYGGWYENRLSEMSFHCCMHHLSFVHIYVLCTFGFSKVFTSFMKTLSLSICIYTHTHTHTHTHTYIYIYIYIINVHIYFTGVESYTLICIYHTCIIENAHLGSVIWDVGRSLHSLAVFLRLDVPDTL